jgi:hypothetical protein
MACFLNEVHYTAKMAGSRMPGRRLDPPLLMALDEIANIAPINIPNFMADAGGRGIQMAIVSHGIAQLRERWGEQGAKIISDTAGCKVFLPGITDTDVLKAASELCGQTAFQEKGQQRLSRHDICDSAMLRELPDGYALLIRGGRAPVLAKLPRAWTDWAYKRAQRQGHAVYQAPASAALSVPREFSLAAADAPDGAHATGNGHHDARAFPWGGDDR